MIGPAVDREGEGVGEGEGLAEGEVEGVPDGVGDGRAVLTVGVGRVASTEPLERWRTT